MIFRIPPPEVDEPLEHYARRLRAEVDVYVSDPVSITRKDDQIVYSAAESALDAYAVAREMGHA